MSDSAETATWYRRNAVVIGAGLKFVIYLGAIFYMLTSSFGQGELVERFTATIAALTGAILRMFGIAAHAEGTRVIGPSFQVRIVNNCNGVYVTALVVAAMLATPASWMRRTLGIAGATAAIYVLNLGRTSSLFAIGSYRHDWFNFFHVYVWETVVVMATLAIFVAWAGWAVPKSGETAG